VVGNASLSAILEEVDYSKLNLGVVVYLLTVQDTLVVVMSLLDCLVEYFVIGDLAGLLLAIEDTNLNSFTSYQEDTHA